MVHVVPSYKMDQDFWHCFGKEKHLRAKLHKTDLGI